MSEAFEELVGDADHDSFEGLVDNADSNESIMLTKTSVNIEKIGVKNTKILPKIESKNKTKYPTKTIQPATDDLLQALSAGAIFTPSIQTFVSDEISAGKQSKKPKSKSSKSNPLIEAKTQVKMRKNLSDSKVDFKLNTSDSDILKAFSPDLSDSKEEHSEEKLSIDTADAQKHDVMLPAVKEIQMKSSSSDSKSSKVIPSTDNYQANSCGKEEESKASNFTEEELKMIDLCLVDQMVDSLINQTFPSIRSSEARYRVKVSPLEIADLAEVSLQNLIQEYPQMSFIFKRQIGKFKKKKGYAEIHFTKMLEINNFLKKLIPVKSVETKLEVTINAWLGKKMQVLSFCISHKKPNKLMTLIKSGQDPNVAVMGTKSDKLEFELIPCGITVPLLQVMFPFSSYVRISRKNSKNLDKKFLIGPASVHYNNNKWLEAVLECFSDFAIDGYPLPCDIKNQNSSGSREEITKDDQRDKTETATPYVKPKEDTGISLPNEETEDFDDNDAVSNMTRDVCTGMLESLDKLKQLDANNPNINRILKMRDQLDILHKSLGSSNEEAHGQEKHKAQHENPWEISREDACDPAKKSKHDRSSNVRRANTRKTRWDTDSSSQWEDDSSKKSSKEKRRGEEEQHKQDTARKEEERKKLIQKIEEARTRDLKKAEERAQMHSIWETNLEKRRESPRKITPVAHLSPSSSTTSSVRRGQGFDRGTNSNRPTKRLFEESKSDPDEGVDDRLAAFERELAEQGAIQHHPSPVKIPKTTNSDNIFMARDSSIIPILMEDEYSDIIVKEGRHALPPKFQVRIQSSLNRQCPVNGCPDTKCFRDKNSFLEHWSIFHVSETTMRFCQKCVAYFMSPSELEMHLEKLHWISPSEAKFMVRQARMKVVTNPSYRDPHPFLPPL